MTCSVCGYDHPRGGAVACVAALSGLVRALVSRVEHLEDENKSAWERLASLDHRRSREPVTVRIA